MLDRFDFLNFKRLDLEFRLGQRLQIEKLLLLGRFAPRNRRGHFLRRRFGDRMRLEQIDRAVIVDNLRRLFLDRLHFRFACLFDRFGLFDERTGGGVADEILYRPAEGGIGQLDGLRRLGRRGSGGRFGGGAGRGIEVERGFGG